MTRVDTSGGAGRQRIDRVVTSGTFSLDGGTWEVENNVWVIGDDDEVVVVDAAHTAAPIIDAVAGRRVVALVCTHGHTDHVTVAPELSAEFGVPALLHPGEEPLWRMSHPDTGYTELTDGQRLEVAGVEIEVIHTPGHSPGSVCLSVPALAAVFSGDTLFQGGPGATGRSFSDFGTIIDSIRNRLLTLPADTVVYTGHGDATTIGTEAPDLNDWITRGH